ncbi:superoxide dismutase, Ni [bacterium]|nr:superoxide dismutase, Ni [bacterium]
MKFNHFRNITTAALIAFAGTAFVTPQSASAHCQIPCGIYDDHARVESMLEDAKTLAKSTAVLADLSGKKDIQSLNQKVRWINNKEIHAENIIQTIANYFLTQRVKSSQADYKERLVKHHAVIVNAMKVKQSSNKEAVNNLVKSIKALAGYYPEHKH